MKQTILCGFGAASRFSNQAELVLLCQCGVQKCWRQKLALLMQTAALMRDAGLENK